MQQIEQDKKSRKENQAPSKSSFADVHTKAGSSNKQKDESDSNRCSLLVSVITFCDAFTIWYHLYNLKNMKNTHGEGLVLVLLVVSLLKVIFLHGCFSCF